MQNSMENIKQENTRWVQQEIPFKEGQALVVNSQSAPEVEQLVLPEEIQEKNRLIEQEYNEMAMRGIANEPV